MKNTIKGEYIIAEIISGKQSDILVLGAPDFTGSTRLFVEKNKLDGFGQGDRVYVEIGFKIETKRIEENGKAQFLEVIKNKSLKELKKVGE